MTNRAADDGGWTTILGKTLLILSLIWNVVVPLLAQDGPAKDAEPVAIDQAGSGELLRRTPDGLVPLPVLDLDVKLDVTGILVHGSVTETFRNPTDSVIDCVYVFPLPERAAVHRMEMRIGERRIVSVIKEKEEAKAVFEKARAEGRKAALVEQRRANLFTTSAANINPGESVEVVLDYLQEVSFTDGEFGLIFPLTLTPRFSTGSPGAGGPIAPPFASAGSPAVPRASLRVRLDAGVPIDAVESDSHAIETFRDGVVTVVGTRGGPIPADRDFRLRWRPILTARPTPALFFEDRPEGRYVLAMILPPLHDVGAGRGLPADTLFVVDVSGSMSGPSIEQARAALLAALDRLRPGDAFDILSFADDLVSFRDAFVPAEGTDLEAGRAFARALSVRGGTRIDLALARGLDIVRGATDDRPRRILFLTDGAVDNEEEILRLVRTGLGPTRLHTLGIGAAPNRDLMRAMATGGRGLCDFVSTTDGAVNRVDAFFARLSRPVMTDLSVSWEDGGARGESYPALLPDLHAGEPLFLSARLSPGGPPPRLVLTGLTSDGGEHLEARPDGPTAADSGIAVRWGRAKIQSLLDTLIDGASPDAVRSSVIDVAKSFGLVSPYTSLVAVEEVPTATGASSGVRVPNGLPPGWGASIDLPQGGTDGPILFLVGMLLALAGTVLLAGALRLPGKRG